MVEINGYSKAKDGGKKLSTNFTVKEFACKDGSDAVLTAPRLVMVLQSIRSHFAAPVVIHSAYRTPQYNAKVGGAAHSQHCYGTAADISVKGQTPAAVACTPDRASPISTCGNSGPTGRAEELSGCPSANLSVIKETSAEDNLCRCLYA